MRNFLKTKKGHKIYKLNLVTQQIDIETDVKDEGDGIVSVEKEQTCWYESAFNLNDVLVKFNARAKRAYEKVNPPN